MCASGRDRGPGWWIASPAIGVKKTQKDNQMCEKGYHDASAAQTPGCRPILLQPPFRCVGFLLPIPQNAADIPHAVSRNS